MDDKPLGIWEKDMKPSKKVKVKQLMCGSERGFPGGNVCLRQPIGCGNLKYTITKTHIITCDLKS